MAKGAAMRSEQEPEPARWRRLTGSKYRVTKAALAVVVGALLSVGLTMAPAGAAVTSTAKVAPSGTAQPETLKTCKIGTNNSYEYYGWCDGTGPTSYRAIAYCANEDAVYGVSRWDGDRRQSYASCEVDGLNSTLAPNPNGDWGLLLCSNDNGAGTYQGYVNRHGDISWMLLNWGNGNIATGGTTLCDIDTNGEAPFDPFVAP
jgi:hypothetical protein